MSNINAMYQNVWSNLSQGTTANIKALAGTVSLYAAGEERGTINSRATAKGFHNGIRGGWHKTAKEFAKLHKLNIPSGTPASRVDWIVEEFTRKAQGRADSLGLKLSANLICDSLDNKPCRYDTMITESKVLEAKVIEALETMTPEQVDMVTESVKVLMQHGSRVETCRKNKASDKLNGLDNAAKKAMAHIDAMVDGIKLEATPEHEQTAFTNIIAHISGLTSDKAFDLIMEAVRAQKKALAKAAKESDVTDVESEEVLLISHAA